MYCEGIVRGHRPCPESNLVVAVEWLDKNRCALNTDWKRVNLHLAGEVRPEAPNPVRPFIVRADLDRRVKWVNAYAFSAISGEAAKAVKASGGTSAD
jgi:hypothetical protein